MVCLAPSPATEFLRGVLDAVDCQAQAIGTEGYQALAAPGSTPSLVLTSLLTLFVALFGYRMLFGYVPGVRDGVLALVKIGIVLTLAASWPAFRTLAYDVVFRGPAELAAEIGRPAGLPGAGGGLVERLQGADTALIALAIVGTGEPGAARPQSVPATPPPPVTGFDALALGGARVMFLVGVIGALASVWLVAGLLLALGPVFVAFLLFEGTRGLFEGWIRVLAGAALGALGTAVALGVELALLEPRFADLLARRAAAEAIPGAPTELLVVTLVFALTLLAMLFAVGRVALGFRLPRVWRSLPAQLAEAVRGGDARQVGIARAPSAAPAATQSRAAAIVDAVAASQRREAMLVPAATAEPSRRTAPHGPQRDFAATPAPVPIGQGFRRRTRTRVSATAGRRDLGA